MSTNKNSGSGEDELHGILSRLIVHYRTDPASERYTASMSLKEAEAAIRAYVERQVLQSRLDELETAWGKYAPGNLGNGYMAKRVATLTQQLKDMEDTK
jgi:hypothetical protein